MEPSVATIDVLAWLSRATLDAMGEAGMIATVSTRPMPSFPILGFGYALNSLPSPGAELHSTEKSENELARAFATIFSTQQEFRILNILVVWFPFLRKLVRPPFQSRLSSSTYVCALAPGVACYARRSSHNAAYRNAAHQ